LWNSSFKNKESDIRGQEWINTYQRSQSIVRKYNERKGREELLSIEDIPFPKIHMISISDKSCSSQQRGREGVGDGREVPFG